MKDDQQVKFTFQPGDDEEESSVKNNEDDAHPVNSPLIDKLNRRMTILFILFASLVSATFYYVYKDIQGNKIVQEKSVAIRKTSVHEIAELSKDMEIRIVKLSEQHDKFKESVKNDMDSVISMTLSLQTALTKIGKDLNKYNSLKAGKKELKATLKKHEKVFASVHKNIEKITEKLDAANQKITTDITEFSDSLKKIETETSILSSVKANKAIVNKSLENERKYFSKKIMELSIKIDKKYASILKIIDTQPSARMDKTGPNKSQVQKTNDQINIIEEDIR